MIMLCGEMYEHTRLGESTIVYDCKLQGNNTALTVACMVNDLAMVSILLKAGAYPNTCNKVRPHKLSCKAHYSQVFST